MNRILGFSKLVLCLCLALVLLAPSALCDESAEKAPETEFALNFKYVTEARMYNLYNYANLSILPEGGAMRIELNVYNPSDEPRTFVSIMITDDAGKVVMLRENFKLDAHTSTGFNLQGSDDQSAVQMSGLYRLYVDNQYVCDFVMVSEGEYGGELANLAQCFSGDASIDYVRLNKQYTCLPSKVLAEPLKLKYNLTILNGEGGNLTIVNLSTGETVCSGTLNGTAPGSTYIQTLDFTISPETISANYVVCYNGAPIYIFSLLGNPYFRP